jgi:hypothetical protein
MGMGNRVEPRPKDHADAAEHVAKELADVAGHFATIKGEAMNWLRDPNLYASLRLRLENARAAVEAATVEARRRVRSNEGDARHGQELRG